MSVRYEGAGVRNVSPIVLRAGDEIGDDVVPEGQLALCFSYDEVFYIVGPKDGLLQLLDRARHRVEAKN
jgi:hypothetical protein